MITAGLAAEAWGMVAAIAGLGVAMCLATIAKMLWYEASLHELKREIREIRIMRREMRKGLKRS